MSVKQDALDELVTEQELLLMDMLKNWHEIKTRLTSNGFRSNPIVIFNIRCFFYLLIRFYTRNSYF